MRFQTFITRGWHVEYNREHWETIKIWCKQRGYLVGNPYLMIGSKYCATYCTQTNWGNFTQSSDLSDLYEPSSFSEIYVCHESQR